MIIPAGVLKVLKFHFSFSKLRKYFFC